LEINRFNGQSPALRESDFSDRNAEIWYTAGREIGKGKVILPDDPKKPTRAQVLLMKRMKPPKFPKLCKRGPS
jgi:hypothetical protein